MRIFDDIPTLRAHLKTPVATVGNFDGLHRGHQAIVATVLDRSRATGGSSLLITFEPHPLKILAPERAPLMLTTRKQKLALIEAAGIEFLLVLPFTMELAEVAAEQFVNEHLAAGLGVREVYVGANFNFGRHRKGDAELLVRLCGDLGIRAAQVAEVRCLDSPVSSSRIRRALQAGEVELARELLGRPYAVQGTVIHGESRGASLGFPTANLATENELVPRDGVYVTEAILEGATRPAVTNIGGRPTFEGANFAVETHILDGGGDLYDRPLEVRFLTRLRLELRFASPQALVDQVRRDIQRARDYFAGRWAPPPPAPAER
jgi:riboflavin kinase/FMN adenylyltransferase